jgi:hypothetical protein
MVVVSFAVCAVVIWLIPYCRQAAWTWAVQWAPNRRFAAEVLSEIGPAARQAIPALKAATDDSDPQARRAAQNAVMVLERSAEANGENTPRKP